MIVSMDLPSSPPTGPINSSLDKAFDILEFLASFGSPQSAPEISRRLKINKVTTYNLLRTLEYRQYLQKNESGKYMLSSKLFELGTLYRSSNPVTHVFELSCLPLLQKYPACNISLGDFGTSMRGVYLSILGSNDSFVSPGTAFPLHATAVGKVLLANSTKEFRSAFFQQATLTKYTENTVTDPEVLKEQLLKIRHQGYCVLDGDLFTDFYCISVPVFSSGRHLAGAISIRGNKSFMTKHKKKLLEDILSMGKYMSANLGCTDFSL